MTEPRTSHAIASHRNADGELAFGAHELPLPPLEPHDLRIEVRAISINPVDRKLAHTREGLQVLGFDASGIVVDTGREVTGFSRGDAVFYAGTIARAGSMQSVHTVDQRLVARAPQSLSLIDAAALPLTAITAWETLFLKLRLDATSTGTMLIVGAAGGVGSVLTQLVRLLLPRVRVIATASRAESVSWARRMGAHDVIDHSGDLRAATREVAPSGVDWIVSTSSQGRVADFATILTPFGAVVGLDAGPIDVTPLKPLSASWHWEFMFTRADPSAFGDAHQKILRSIAALVDDGRLSTTRLGRSKRLTPDSLKAAYALSESGRSIGKSILTLG